MSSKRSSRSDSSSSSLVSPKRAKPSSSDTLKLYIIPAKLADSTVSSLRSLVDNSKIYGLDLELCSQPELADVLITALRMKPRLERYIPWNQAKHKSIVTPNWLRDSIKNKSLLSFSGDYIAISKATTTTQVEIPEQPLLPTVAPGRLNYTARFCCQRATPLICTNESLVGQLSVLRLNRELEGLDINALSYERAIAALRSFPFKINEQNLEQVGTLPYIGAKMKWKIAEFVDRGEIPERSEILASERFQSLSLFTSVYGIGPKTARTLYSLGLRTLDDLIQYYSSTIRPRTATVPILSTSTYLELYHSLSSPIPRSEVSEIHKTIMVHVDALQPGCWSTITGGYRRGKEQSNDVDIVITHPEEDIRKSDLAGRLVKELFSAGLITHVATTGFNVKTTLLTVFRLPGGLHRRVDLIMSPIRTYWCAVVGWTGSKTFERDLRLYAKEKRAMKFDSYDGVIRLRDSKAFYPKSEKEVFDLLGLEWVEPTLRNA